MSFIADVFPKLFTAKDVVTEISKRPRFKTVLNSQDVKGFKTLQKSAQQHFYRFVWSIWEKLSYKTSLLVISETFGLFANTFSADDKYPLYNREKLLQSIEIQLSKKLKLFLSIFILPFLKSLYNLEHLKKMMSLLADVFLKW